MAIVTRTIEVDRSPADARYSARAYAIRCQWNVPDEVFMILALEESGMKGVAGLARYRAEFAKLV